MYCSLHQNCKNPKVSSQPKQVKEKTAHVTKQVKEKGKTVPVTKQAKTVPVAKANSYDLADPDDPNSLMFNKLTEIDQLRGYQEVDEIEEAQRELNSHESKLSPQQYEMDQQQLSLRLVEVLAAIRFNNIYSDLNEEYCEMNLNRLVDKPDFLVAYNAAQKQWMTRWSDLGSFYHSNVGAKMIVDNLVKIYPQNITTQNNLRVNQKRIPKLEYFGIPFLRVPSSYDHYQVTEIT